MDQPKNNLKFAFFGTSRFAVLILDELLRAGFLPQVVITSEDKPKGRKLVLTPTEAKVWALEHSVPVISPASLKTANIVEEIKKYSPSGFDLFIVASYGKIIPQNILDIPRRETLNVHPSLLPKLRGASPIQSAILTENETGVTIMRLDDKMDHGPIIAQKKVSVPEWPPYANDLENLLAHIGGELLSRTIPWWISGDFLEQEQDHSQATLCGKIEKTDAELHLADSPEINLRKIRAYHIWPGAYFFVQRKDKQIRVIVKRARVENGSLVLERVIPEGKKEMDYADFERGN